MTTEINTAELRKLAESATSGPWAYTGPEYGDEGGVFFNIESPAEVILGEFGPSKANAKFIAAADPSTMLALLDRLAVLEDENERMIDKIGELHDRVAAASQQGSEPVAWMRPTGHGTGWRDRAPDGEFAHKWTPLFTHPIAPADKAVPAKTCGPCDQYPNCVPCDDRKAVLSRGDAGAVQQKKLRRGTTGVCRRSRDCVCEQEGLWDECIWLVPAEKREECGGAKESK
jgi:hypothetical protein